MPSLGSGSRPASVHVRPAPTPVPYGASPELAGTHTSTSPPPQPPRWPEWSLDPSCTHVPPPPPPPPPLPAHLLSGLAEHDLTATALPVVTVTTPASAASSTVAAAMTPKAAVEGPSPRLAPSEVPGVATLPTSSGPAPLAPAGSVVVGSAASDGAASVGAMDLWEAATRRREGSVGTGRTSGLSSSASATSFSAAACAAAFSAASFAALASASESAMPSKAASPSATPPRAVSPTSHAEHTAQHTAFVASAGSVGEQILQSWTRGVGASTAPPPPPATIASTAAPIAPSATVAAAMMSAPSVAAVLLRDPDLSRKTAYVTAYTSPAPLASPSLVPQPPAAPCVSITLPSAVSSVRRASTHEQPPLSAARASPLHPPAAPTAASPKCVHGAAATGAAAPSGEQKGRWEGETWVPGEPVHERGTPLAPPEPAAGAVGGAASSLSAMGAAHYAWAHVGSAHAYDEIDPAMEMASEMVAVQTMLSRMAAARTQSHAASPSVASLAPEEGADGAADGAAAVAAVGQAAVAGGLPTQEEYTNPCNDLLPQRRGGAASTVKASHGLAAQGKLTNPNARRPATAAPDAPPPAATAAGASAVAITGTKSATTPGAVAGAIAAATSAVEGACDAGESGQIAAFGATAATVLPVPAVGYTRMVTRPRTYVAASELRSAATRPDGQMVPWGGAVQGAHVRALPPPRYLELRAHQAKGAVGAGGEERRRQPGACAFRSTRRSRSLQRSEEEGEARHLPPDRPTRLSRLRERHKKEALETAPPEPFVGRTARADFYSVGWLE